jgi:hypothetical protein
MSLFWFSLGGLAWTASEYAIHRLVGHGARRKKPESLAGRISLEGLFYELNAEHLAHHADPQYFAPTSRKAAAAGAAIPLVTAALVPFVGLRRAVSFAAGFSATYATYEGIHRRIHTHAPTSGYARFVRRHHLLHHHKTPKENYGVTTPLWDKILRTDSTLDTLRVPRGAAPAWMVGADGEVKPEHAADYVLVGPKSSRAAENAAQEVVQEIPRSATA